MERLEPKKGRSPISSLNFERKSDFKKFLKFIKNETEELKGIVEPKRKKVGDIHHVEQVVKKEDMLNVYQHQRLLGCPRNKNNRQLVENEQLKIKLEEVELLH